jgi:hypothetical protein
LHNIAVSVIQELLDAGEVEHVFDLIDKNISRFLEGLHA